MMREPWPWLVRCNLRSLHDQFVAVGVPGNGFKHFIIRIVLIAVRRNLCKNVTG